MASAVGSPDSACIDGLQTCTRLSPSTTRMPSLECSTTACSLPVSSMSRVRCSAPRSATASALTSGLSTARSRSLSRLPSPTSTRMPSRRSSASSGAMRVRPQPAGRPLLHQLGGGAGERQQRGVEGAQLGDDDARLVGEHDPAGALLVAFQHDAGADPGERLAQPLEEGEQQVVGDQPAGQHLGEPDELLGALALVRLLGGRPVGVGQRRRRQQGERQQRGGVHRRRRRRRRRCRRCRRP